MEDIKTSQESFITCKQCKANKRIDEYYPTNFRWCKACYYAKLQNYNKKLEKKKVGFEKLTEEQRNILKEAITNKKKIIDICKLIGMSAPTFLKWKKLQPEIYKSIVEVTPIN